MSLIFKFYSNFNEDISSWDVSNVNNMNGMFHGASSFNQDISSWDVSNVTACDNFSMGAYSWTLPQPNFTNCTP
ncbi:BspA family leucine-rich repeat surface protein [Flavobacteriaceae bacterium]|nr:BspA family leucine-rich repeat surface protein [Flavobacteriaceae bacterium]